MTGGWNPGTRTHMFTSNPGARIRWRDEKGAILPMVAIAMVTLFGFTGLAMDVGMLYRHRRVMQTAADAGALAGASEIYRRQTALVAGAARTATAANQFTDGADGVLVTVHYPPVSGFYAGNLMFVETVIGQPSPTYFMKALGWDSVQIPARAVAGVGASGRYCIYILDPAMAEAYRMENDAALDANCGIIVNSNHPSAMTAQNTSSVTATGISVTGGTVVAGATVSPTPVVGVPPEPDPLAYLQPPLIGGCSQTNFTRSSGTTTVSPGVFCGGIHLENNARLSLNPGMYIIRGGGLQIENVSVLEGTGVTFFLTDGFGTYRPITFENATTVRLSAPTTGPYAGILFYQDPNAGTTSAIHRFENGTSSFLEGALYFPTQVLRFENLTNTEARYTLILAREMNMENLAGLRVRNDYGGLPGGSPVKRISLVE
jgi:hypothetical protein